MSYVWQWTIKRENREINCYNSADSEELIKRKKLKSKRFQDPNFGPANEEKAIEGSESEIEIFVRIEPL